MRLPFTNPRPPWQAAYRKGNNHKRPAEQGSFLFCFFLLNVVVIMVYPPLRDVGAAHPGHLINADFSKSAPTIIALNPLISSSSIQAFVTLTCMKEWLLNKLHITRKPVVKVYNGYGDADTLLIFGHVLRQSPLPKTKFKKNIWSNAFSLLRMFLVKPFRGVKVMVNWQGDIHETTTDEDGFFKFEWKPERCPDAGWHKVLVTMEDDEGNTVSGEGKALVPHAAQYAFVSDIDDTFLISHSASLRKRLYLLLTKNARTRRPFEGVVKHYQLLARSGAYAGTPNPFFYISASEWNLYDYIREFKTVHNMPEGVYLLSRLKLWHKILQTGQGKHTGKFMRIARVMKEFPHQRFVLLGDDTQRDPEIYTKIVEGFGGQVACVYLRNVSKKKRPEVEHFLRELKRMGKEVCYFKHSREAIEHSKKIGLIGNM